MFNSNLLELELHILSIRHPFRNTHLLSGNLNGPLDVKGRATSLPGAKQIASHKRLGSPFQHSRKSKYVRDFTKTLIPWSMLEDIEKH